MRVRAGRVFTGRDVHAPGLVEIDADRVAAVGPDVGAPMARDEVVDLGDVTIAPGLVDVHCHGGGGATVSTDPAAVVAYHLGQGTTTLVASLVTQPLDVLRDQVSRLSAQVATGEPAGIHLEGPWLAESFRGAHPADRLRDPDPVEIESVLDAGEGTVRMVTIAAERPGGLDSVRLLESRGVVAALGHTAATLQQAGQAIAAGVTGATHLFNAMPPLMHRDPGPVLALLDDERVFLELIADGVHVDLAVIRWVAGLYPDRVVLVTDAMAAAGSPDGQFVLGDMPVEVRDGIARVAGTRTLAGSTLTLSRAVRTAIAAGVDWRTALRAATLTPACYLGLAGTGELRPGAKADLVVLDADWHVRRVMRHGAWIEPDMQAEGRA